MEWKNASPNSIFLNCGSLVQPSKNSGLLMGSLWSKRAHKEGGGGVLSAGRQKVGGPLGQLICGAMEAGKGQAVVKAGRQAFIGPVKQGQAGSRLMGRCRSPPYLV